MSWDITLCDPVSKEALETDVPHLMRGGTYQVGGTTRMTLNITYNYGVWYDLPNVFPREKGIRGIYGLSGAESIPILTNAIRSLEKLKNSERTSISHSNSYWDSTVENAIKPLYSLLALAKLRPDGIWEGD